MPDGASQRTLCHSLPLSKRGTQEPPANLARYASLAALLAAAAANPTIAAVTPAGETKRRLRSPVGLRFGPQAVITECDRSPVQRSVCVCVCRRRVVPWTP
jgi:hypothetical protein